MDTSNKDQFKKLTNEEKDKIIKDLILHPEEIICKSMSELFVVKPLALKENSRLTVEFIQKEPSLQIGEEIISQFLFNRENLYIFKCDFNRVSSLPCLLLNSDFYMIQRRENYRLKFPSTLGSKVIVKFKGEIVLGKVFDLSTTGIRVGSTNKANFLAVGTEVEMEIQVIGHDPLKISAQMRHRTEGFEIINEKKIGYFYYGYQFISLTKDNEKSLSRINMELYRNFLQKVTG